MLCFGAGLEDPHEHDQSRGLAAVFLLVLMAVSLASPNAISEAETTHGESSRRFGACLPCRGLKPTVLLAADKTHLALRGLMVVFLAFSPAQG